MLVDRARQACEGQTPTARAVTRSLSHTLKRARGGHTTDDATLLMVEWRG
jgi:hypothetical protein